MSKLVTVSGILTVQSDVVNGQCLNTKQLALGGSCSGGSKYYQATVCSQLELATAGLVGAAFEDLDAITELTRVELLYVRSSAEIALRFYAIAASAVASAGSYPTGFAGAETLDVTIDGTVVNVVFDAADQSVDQVVARINAAMALAGIATPRASAVNGQVRIDGVETALGSGGVGQLSFAGTGAAQLGLDAGSNPTIVDAQGQDVHLNGLGLFEFPATGDNLLTAVEISGTATVDVLAAGRSQ